MQPLNAKFFTLQQAGSNVVESAVILGEFVAAPHPEPLSLNIRSCRESRGNTYEQAFMLSRGFAGPSIRLS